MNYLFLNSYFDFNSIKKIVIITAKIFLFLAVSSCKNNVVETEKEILKDPREMVWTADTLSYPESIQTAMNKILAFNSNDIFIYGHNFDTRGKVYHFEGNRWEVFPLAEYIGGFNVWKMISFGRNNIWGVGDRGGVQGLIFNYDGKTWSEKNDYAKFSQPLTSIDGENSTELYACGKNGVIWYYKNGNWYADTIKVNRPNDTMYLLSSLAVHEGEVFIIGYAMSIATTQNWEKRYFIRGKYKNFTIVDSMDFTQDLPQKWGVAELIKGENKKLYSRGPRGMYEWNGTEWINFHKTIYLWGLYVYRDNYMLTLGTGGAEYFNGSAWIDLSLTILSKFKDVNFFAAWTDGKELFLIGIYWNSFPFTTIVLHGK